MTSSSPNLLVARESTEHRGTGVSLTTRIFNASPVKFRRHRRATKHQPGIKIIGALILGPIKDSFLWLEPSARACPRYFPAYLTCGRQSDKGILW